MSKAAKTAAAMAVKWVVYFDAVKAAWMEEQMVE